jgi:hypothetical protein
MDDAKQQLLDKLQNSNNILVTVSRNPSVDQLASCIGLTLLLNKQGKHAAAVFSGKVPSTLEFLQPEETLEKNTDSLRDFIIALDKAKADKLRYKVEEDVVRIFITPYKTSLSEADLEFSEGDFNVDVVVALGVLQQEDLDQAITAHGRILHDATVTSLNAAAEGGLGTINWNDPQASSLSELVSDLAQALDPGLLDEQIATALMTGIVAETGRFSNDRTTSQTMSASALLMSAGANQQLVANELEHPSALSAPASGPAGGEDDGDDNGLLEIDHANDAKPEPPAIEEPAEPPAPPPAQAEPPMPEEPPAPEEPAPSKPASGMSPGAKLVTEPPQLGGTLTANSQSERLDPVTDPFSLPTEEAPELLSRKDDEKDDKPALTAAPKDWTPPAAPPAPEPPAPTLPASAPAAPAPKKPDDKETLTDIEKSVHSPHVSSGGASTEGLDTTSLDSVRDEVNKALSGSGSNDPIEALNAQPLGDELHPGGPSQGSVKGPALTPPPPADPPAPAAPQKDDDKKDDGSPPPVPPPIPFQFGNSPPSQ